MNTVDGHGQGLKIDSQDVERLRKDPSNIEAFARIYTACRDWVEDRATRLSEQDRRDIVSQAIYENIEILRFNVIPAEEVPEIFATSLNKNLRVRARCQFGLGESRKACDDFEKAFDEFNALDLEGKSNDRRTREERKRRLLAAIFLIGKYLRRALDMLLPHDYAIVYFEYKLHALKGLKAPEIPVEGFSTPPPRKAILRARGHFLDCLEKVLLQEVSGENPAAIEDAIKLIRCKDFEEALNGLHGSRG